MWIQRLDREKTAREYNILCQDLYPWKGVVTPPFGAAWAIIEPGGITKRHNHNERETFFVVQGRGVMRVGGEQTEVKVGDVIYLPPFENHTLTNTSQTEDLIFLTVYWDDAAVWTAGLGEAAAPEGRARRVLVTAAPPTPNGEIHLGHLSGPYLAADIHTRYLRLRGVEAHYLSGTDDNQSYVPVKAAKMGLPPGEAADRLAALIEEAMRAARIDMDLFIRPNASPYHASMVQQFLRKLHEDGKLIAKETLSPYCDACERYLFEAHIRGRCPHCGQPTGGNSCEDCGRPNDCADLVDPVCTGCGAAPGTREVTRLHFPLHRYADALRNYHHSVAMNPNLRSLCEQVIAAGLPDIAVTHPASWGIPVPIEGFEDQRIYAWFEMAPRYLAYAQQLSEALGSPGGWERSWKAADAQVVQCFGFDNGFFYAVFVPALLQAYDPEIRLTSAFVMNEFYRLDGLKFSTSRNHAIWGRETLARVPADVVRFYLAYTCPEAESTNFTLSDFEATVERELCGAWQGWLGDLGGRVARDFGGEVPATGDWTEEHRRFCQRLQQLTDEASIAYEAPTFSPQKAARTLCELVREARRFGKAEEHWRRVSSRHEEQRTGVALQLLAAKTLARLAAPLMPDFAERLWRDLGYEAPLASDAWEERPAWVPSGRRIGGLSISYFQSILGTLTFQKG